MFSCKKCKEPFYVLGAELRGNTLRVQCQCLKGHKGKRDLSRYQADSMAPEIFKGLFTCTMCGSTMSIIRSDVDRHIVEYIFLCPVHGVIPKQIPSYYHNAVLGITESMKDDKSILNSRNCPKCGQLFATNEIEEKKGILTFKYRCPAGHKELRYVPANAEESIHKAVFKRLLHCEQCGLPCQVDNTSIKGDKAKIEAICPAHGKQRKEMPARYERLIDKIADALSEGSIVQSMLKCTDCSNNLSIRSVEIDKDKYKLKCSCSNGHNRELVQPTDLDAEAIDSIIEGVLKCNDCDLLMDVVGTKVSGNMVELELVCPVHNCMKKSVAGNIYKHLEERESHIDRTDTIDKSLICDMCPSPVTIKETKVKDDIVELKVVCRNRHGSERYLSRTAKIPSLERYYMQLYECYKCHGKRDLVDIIDDNGKSIAHLCCTNDKESEFQIPEDHKVIVRDAYLNTKSLSDLEVLVEKKLENTRACEYQMNSSADVAEMLDIVSNVINQHSVLFVGEKGEGKSGNEIWYYGKALDGDEFVVVGSVSKEELSIRISISSNNEKKLEVMLAEMRENLREILLRIQTKSDDTAPRKIACPQCNAALEKRALPGETILCDHCGTPLHFG